MLEARVEAVLGSGDDYSDLQALLSDESQQKAGLVLCSERIVTRTTTGALIYREEIHNARPDIPVIKEAGKVLESHVPTALSRSAL